MSNITQESDLAGLSLLGNVPTEAYRKLETFPNHHPGRDYTVTLQTNEFTCVCPTTGQPDFAKLTIRYVPNQRLVESKSLKLYLWSYRAEGAFHEHVANVILDDLVKALEPRSCRLVAGFSVRGGISLTVEAEYRQPETRPGSQARGPESNNT